MAMRSPSLDISKNEIGPPMCVIIRGVGSELSKRYRSFIVDTADIFSPFADAATADTSPFNWCDHNAIDSYACMNSIEPLSVPMIEYSPLLAMASDVTLSSTSNSRIGSFPPEATSSSIN